jgi:hypothetical protein
LIQKQEDMPPSHAQIREMAILVSKIIWDNRPGANRTRHEPWGDKLAAQENKKLHEAITPLFFPLPTALTPD